MNKSISKSKGKSQLVIKVASPIPAKKNTLSRNESFRVGSLPPLMKM